LYSISQVVVPVVLRPQELSDRRFCRQGPIPAQLNHSCRNAAQSEAVDVHSA
jgi:hypothetical protein